MAISKENINVFLRCRPPVNSEIKVLKQSILKYDKNNSEIIIEAKIGEKNFHKKFIFDKIFNEQTNQKDIYKAIVEPIVEEVLKGYHCTIFAYGQTGTGKTYTIEGERSNKFIPWEKDPLAGIIPRALLNIFRELSKYNGESSVRISAVQIYNEEIFDLLNESDIVKLKLFEDNVLKGSVLIQGLTEVPVCNTDQAYYTIEKAMLRRQTNATFTHGASSRSHAVFFISVSTKTNTKTELFKMGKLTLVDLAGSENIGRSGAVDKQAREAGSINQSLLTLNRVTMALVKKAVHVPYRESKLTRMLQDSLGGHCKTTLIATVSPAASNIEETLSTLEYACLAKNVVNHPKANQKSIKVTSMRDFTSKMSHLQRDLFATLEKSGVNIPEETYNSLENELSNTRKTFNEKTNEVEKLQEKLEEVSFQATNTKNELSEKKIELDKCKTYLEKVIVQLKKDRKKLNSVQNKLQKSQHEFESVKQLVSHHKRSEIKLKNQASKVLEVVENSTSDADLLHFTLERKNQMEKENTIILQDMKDGILKKINLLKTCVEEMDQKHRSSYNDLEKNFGVLVEIHKKRSDDIHNVLNTFQNSFSKNINHLTNDLKFENHKQNMWYENHLKANEKTTPMFQGSVDDMKTKIKSLDERQIVHNFNLTKEMKIDIQNNFENLTKTVQNNTIEQNHVLNEIKTFKGDYEEEKKQRCNSSEVIVTNLQKSAKEMTENWIKINEKVHFWIKDTRRITEKHKACNNYIPKHTEKIKQAKLLLEKNKTVLLSNSVNLQQSATALENSFKSSINSWHEEIDDKMQQFTEVSEIGSMQNELLKENIKNLTSKIETDLNENVEQLKNSMNEYSKASAFELRQTQAEINESYNISNKVDDDYNKMLHVQKELQTNHVNSQFSILQDIKNKNNLQVENTLSIIKSFENNIGNCLENFKKYIPTGVTPIRKTYTYPKKLPIQTTI